MTEIACGDVVAFSFRFNGIDYPPRYGDVIAVEGEWIVIRNHQHNYACPIHVMHANQLELVERYQENIRLAA